jgi:DNA polymerase III subunit epsilon
MKILYFDTETTGISPEKNDIVQLSGMVEIDGKVVEEFNLRCQPFSFENVQREALEVTGLTLTDLMSYPKPDVLYDEFIDILMRYVDKYDKNDKFYPAGYNVRFDLEFMNQFFKKNGDNYWGSFCNWKAIDGLPMMHFLELCNHVSLPNYKLSTVCEFFGIEIDAHDALSDIRATKQLLDKLKTYIVELPR